MAIKYHVQVKIGEWQTIFTSEKTPELHRALLNSKRDNPELDHRLERAESSICDGCIKAKSNDGNCLMYHLSDGHYTFHTPISEGDEELEAIAIANNATITDPTECVGFLASAKNYEWEEIITQSAVSDCF